MGVLKWFWVGCAAVATAAAATEPVMVRGEIGGAKYTWMQPAQWNHAVLLVAHDWRPETAALKADFSPQASSYRQLCQDGWIVAQTSFRRNGPIVLDAIHDLDALRAEIEKRFGPPHRVLIEGNAMGGLIALAIAERNPEIPPLYDGVIAIDPSFTLRGLEENFSGITMQPKIPVVFLCNHNQADSALRYMRLNLPKTVRPFVPVVLRVNRDGHLNVNQAERWVALATLNDWLEANTPTMKSPDEKLEYIDVTRVPEPSPSRVFFDEDRHGFTAHIEDISEDDGVLTLDAQAVDFADAGIVPNAWFRAEIHGHGYRVRYGRDFASVKRASWVAVLNADGFFWLTRNLSNAEKTVDAQLGDLVHVTRYETQKEDPAHAEETETEPE